MKMLVITSIKEDLQVVTDVFEKVQIPVFSVSDTIGHKAAHHNYLLNNWFASGSDQTEALFFFSFTEDNKAVEALQQIKELNEKRKNNFPVHAFILPVEASSL